MTLTSIRDWREHVRTARHLLTLADEAGMLTPADEEGALRDTRIQALYDAVVQITQAIVNLERAEP